MVIEIFFETPTAPKKLILWENCPSFDQSSTLHTGWCSTESSEGDAMRIPLSNWMMTDNWMIRLPTATVIHCFM